MLSFLLGSQALNALSITQFTQLISLITHLRNRIIWSQSVRAQAAPLNLPTDVAKFSSAATGIEEVDLQVCWQGLQTNLWEKIIDEVSDDQLRNNEHVQMFAQLGTPLKIGESFLLYCLCFH